MSDGSIEPIKLKIGSPVSRSHFYPRDQVVRRLRRALKRDHVSFLAPRRTGKTSVLIHLEETAESDHPHLRVNLEKCTRPDQMIAALLVPFQKKPERWKQKLGSCWSRIESIDLWKVGVKLKDAPAVTDWQPAAESLLDALLEQGGKFTFLLDEFPILVDAAAKQ
ncbi:MAG: hypothetical protein KDN19_09045, partial [Verrucomicrobiae bacterium]|nr:hypothetical protein [Verrucomicrobiae bacterium]